LRRRALLLHRFFREDFLKDIVHRKKQLRDFLGGVMGDQEIAAARDKFANQRRRFVAPHHLGNFAIEADYLIDTFAAGKSAAVALTAADRMGHLGRQLPHERSKPISFPWADRRDGFARRTEFF